MFRIFDSPRPYLRNIVKHENDEPSKTCCIRDLTIEDYGFKSVFKEKKSQFVSKSKNLSFRFIYNDQTQQSLMWLLAAKNVFVSELFNMRSSYVSKLVFNKYHQMLLAIEDGFVIGGICFRVFKPLCEIVFFAISNDFKTRGYGTQMMRVFKTHMQTIGVTDIYTYADNNAKIFFNRNGFSFYSHLPDTVWKGKIKDYNDATLLSAHVYPNFDYMKTDAILNAQIKEIEKNLGKTLIRRVNKFPLSEYSGITIGKRIAPNVLDNMKAALQKIREIPTSDLFSEPIEIEEYKKIIKNPMDFETIHKRLFSPKVIYKSFDEFKKDIDLIFSNCYTYNVNENAYTKAARSLQAEAEKILQKYRV